MKRHQRITNHRPKVHRSHFHIDEVTLDGISLPSPTPSSTLHARTHICRFTERPPPPSASLEEDERYFTRSPVYIPAVKPATSKKSQDDPTGDMSDYPMSRETYRLLRQVDNLTSGTDFYREEFYQDADGSETSRQGPAFMVRSKSRSQRSRQTVVVPDIASTTPHQDPHTSTEKENRRSSSELRHEKEEEKTYTRPLVAPHIRGVAVVTGKKGRKRQTVVVPELAPPQIPSPDPDARPKTAPETDHSGSPTREHLRTHQPQFMSTSDLDNCGRPQNVECSESLEKDQSGMERREGRPIIQTSTSATSDTPLPIPANFKVSTSVDAEIPAVAECYPNGSKDNCLLKKPVKNYKSTDNLIGASDDKDIGETVKQARDESGNKSEEKVEGLNKEEKPWRKNMSVAPLSKGPGVDDLPCNHATGTFTEPQRNEIRKFMNKQYKKRVAESRQQEAQSTKQRQEVADRLLRLEAKRKKILSPKKKGSRAGSSHVPASSKPLVGDEFRRHATETRLRHILNGLNTEMRAKFSVGVDNSVDVQPKDKVPKEEDLLSSIPPLGNERIGMSTTPKVAEEISTHQQETIKEDKVTLTTANVTISGPADKELSLHGSLDETLPSTNNFSSDINVVQQSNNNITTISGSSNKNQEVKDTRKHNPMETAQVVTQQFNNIALREKVKELQLRHKRDLELIRNVAAEQVVDKVPGPTSKNNFVSDQRCDTQSELDTVPERDLSQTVPETRIEAKQEEVISNRFYSNNTSQASLRDKKYQTTQSVNQPENQIIFAKNSYHQSGSNRESNSSATSFPHPKVPQNDAQTNQFVSHADEKSSASLQLSSDAAAAESKVAFAQPRKSAQPPKIVAGEGSAVKPVPADNIRQRHISSTAGDESEEHPPNIHQAEQLPTTLGETTFNMSSKSPAEVAILLPQNDQFNFAQTLARKIHSVEITKLSSDTGSLDVQNLRKEDLSEGPLPSSADASSSRLPRVSAKDTTKLQLSEGPLSSSTDSEAGNAENKKPMSAQNDKREEDIKLPSVPSALQLRFQAELNQLEVIQQAENQLNQLSHFKEAVEAYNILQPQALRHAKTKKKNKSHGGERVSWNSKKGKRQEFEEKVRAEMHSFIKNNSSSSTIGGGGNQASGDVNVTTTKEEEEKVSRGKKAAFSSGGGKKSSISSEIRSLMTRVDSSIPEVISMLERNDDGSIQGAISEAIEELSFEGGIRTGIETGQSTESNITEEIAQELTPPTVTDKKVKQNRNMVGKIEKKSHNLHHSSSGTKASALRSTLPVQEMYKRHMIENVTRIQHQMSLIESQEKMLEVEAATFLAKIDHKLKKHSGNLEKTDQLKAKKVKVALHVQKRLDEFGVMKDNLRISEKEVKLMLKQHNTLKTAEEVEKVSEMSSDETLTISLVEEIDGRRKPSAEASVGQVNLNETVNSDFSSSNKSKKKMATLLKAPLSPQPSSTTNILAAKSPTLSFLRRRSRRSSGGESDDSVSMVLSDVDRSDKVGVGVSGNTLVSGSDTDMVEIGIGVLKEELKRRMATVATLKKNQADQHREKLRVQEEALKKQIESYDNLIEKTKTELLEQTASSTTNLTQQSGGDQHHYTQPLIKSPKQQVAELASSATASVTASPSPAASPEIKGHDQLQLKAATLTPPPVKFDIDTSSANCTLGVLGARTATPSTESNYSEDFNTLTPTVSAVVKASEEPAKQQDESLEEDTLGDTTTHSSTIDSVTTTSENLTVKTDNLVANILSDLIRDTGDAISNANVNQHSNLTVGEQLPEIKSAPVNPRQVTKPSSQHGALSTKNSTKPQDLMVTAFDLSEESSTDETATPPKSPIQVGIDLDAAYPSENGDTSQPPPPTSAVDGVFIDDDFGLSLQQESENIRQQQMLIEKEISRIQEESRIYDQQQNQSLKPLQRSIPDKPPPPYTPPAPSSTDPKSQKVLAVRPPPPEPVKYVPSSKTQVHELTTDMVKDICRRKAADSTFDVTAATWDTNNNSSSSSKDLFVSFVHDAVKEIALNILAPDSEAQNPIWMPQKPIRKMLMSVPRTEPLLIRSVRSEVNILLGYEKRAQKENLIVRWSPQQKRRDRVDQILVRELHAEEADWTDFSRDEAQVKDALANNLMQALINDTVDALKKAYAL